MNPSTWRKYYKPCYKEIFDIIHAKGLDVWMHTDGNVTEIIPDLIEIGLDVLNPVQPSAMDIHRENLAMIYRSVEELMCRHFFPTELHRLLIKR